MPLMLLKANLPDDPDALRAIIVAHREERRALNKQVASLKIAGAEADAENAGLTAIIVAFQRHRFGARSEKLGEQLELAFEELDAALARVQAGLDAAVVRSGGIKPRKTNRGSLPEHLERIEQVVDIEDKAYACCGDDLHVIGEDVAERLGVVPRPSAC